MNFFINTHTHTHQFLFKHIYFIEEQTEILIKGFCMID